MNFIPERLISLRQSLGISKAAAARMLNMSAMGYGRYESGEREPSYQTVAFIAQAFNSSIEYLYGNTDDKNATTITISSKDEPDLFLLVQSIRNDKNLLERLLTYTENIKNVQ
ncbi:helix-turn-helix domain-containing protein [Sporofaciens sp. SGI.106]|uniref:helix-turn-helix domain-containing protein n=1 Tax=Sporofaciens sp. SGI.106 TaxID=3420568 RepID=UPI002A98CD8D|nr:helix-turn-helix transcriptional regulator [Lachnoclostridium sp.]